MSNTIRLWRLQIRQEITVTLIFNKLGSLFFAYSQLAQWQGDNWDSVWTGPLSTHHFLPILKRQVKLKSIIIKILIHRAVKFVMISDNSLSCSMWGCFSLGSCNGKLLFVSFLKYVWVKKKREGVLYILTTSIFSYFLHSNSFY